MAQEKILFLYGKDAKHVKDLNVLLNGAIRAGKEVYLGDVNSIRADNSQVVADVAPILSEVSPYEFSLNEVELSAAPLTDYDIVWPAYRGNKEGFLDRIQLLGQVHNDTKTKVVNSPHSLLFNENKYSHLLDDRIKQPLTFSSGSADKLFRTFLEEGLPMIVKPVARSMGRDVYPLDPKKPKEARDLIKKVIEHNNGEHAVLQEFIPEMAKHDKRVLMAGGKIIDFNARIAGENSTITTLAQGGRAEDCNLSREERELCNYIGQKMMKEGCPYIGIDLCFPYVTEVNIVNPGGLEHINRLKGVDHSEEVVNEVCKAVRRQNITSQLAAG